MCSRLFGLDAHSRWSGGWGRALDLSDPKAQALRWPHWREEYGSRYRWPLWRHSAYDLQGQIMFGAVDRVGARVILAAIRDADRRTSMASMRFQRPPLSRLGPVTTNCLIPEHVFGWVSGSMEMCAPALRRDRRPALPGRYSSVVVVAQGGAASRVFDALLLASYQGGIAMGSLSIR